MDNRQVTLDCPVCGARHSGLPAAPARDPLWPYRIECPVTCIHIPVRFDARRRATIKGGRRGAAARPTERRPT